MRKVTSEVYRPDINEFFNNCWDGKEQEVKKALQDDSDLVYMQRKSDKWTPLHSAAYTGEIGIVQLLLAHQANPSPCLLDDHWTPLHYAAQNNHKSTVEELMNKGADMRAKDKNGWTPFHCACVKGNRQIVKLMLDKGMDPNLLTPGCATPLGIAAHEDHTHIVELLLQSGADPNLMSGVITPLHVACKEGFERVVELLLEAGADVFTTNKEGETPLEVAQKKGYSSIVTLLNNEKQKSRGVVKQSVQQPLIGKNRSEEKLKKSTEDVTISKLTSELMSALEFNDLEEVKKILINYPDTLHVMTQQKNTLLHLTCRNGQLEAVKLLLNFKIWFQAKNQKGNTALHYACKGNYFDIANLLVSHGAIAQPNHEGKLPLDFVAPQYKPIYEKQLFSKLAEIP